MDARLRQLKRQAESDPSFWPNYARELERSLTGEEFQHLETEDFNIFNEETVAYADYKPEYGDDPQTVGGFEMHLEGCGRGPQAWYVATNWQEPWDEDDATEIAESLSSGFVALLAAAEARGYQHVILWVD